MAGPGQTPTRVILGATGPEATRTKGSGLGTVKTSSSLYEAWIDTEGAGNRSVEAALETIRSKGTTWDDADIDIETARRVIRDLYDLLRPG